jgi:cellulose synthase/poly-beta-1,6-N-acetylglucosamine synthase-like glycosyltransferase
MNEPLISVVIAVKDGQKTIARCLDSVLNIAYETYEVIVVDDGSTDKTLEILKNYSAKIQVISNPVNLGPSEARNIAAAKACGEYLAFTDGDCIVDKNWLKELLSGFGEPDVVSVGGRQEVAQDESEFGRRIFKFMKKVGFISDYTHKERGEIVLVNHNPSCNVMYKRNIFLREDGFLKGLWPGEDVELDYRLKNKGYKLSFNPKALVYHYKPATMKSFLRMMYKYGWAQGFLVRRYGIFRKIHFLPFLSTLIFFILVFSLFFNKLIIFLGVGLLLLFLFIFFNFNIYLFLLGSLGYIFWNTGFYKSLIFKNR